MMSADSVSSQKHARDKTREVIARAGSPVNKCIDDETSSLDLPSSFNQEVSLYKSHNRESALGLQILFGVIHVLPDYTASLTSYLSLSLPPDDPHENFLVLPKLL